MIYHLYSDTFLTNFTVLRLKSEHFDLSMQVGEQVLFPRVRTAQPDEIIVASGTSCRHQIEDGTGRKALHVVEVMLGALSAS